MSSSLFCLLLTEVSGSKCLKSGRWGRVRQNHVHSTMAENIKTLSVLAFCKVGPSAVCSGFPTKLLMNEVFQGLFHTALLFHWSSASTLNR